MKQPFFDLQATHNPYRWYLPLKDSLCVGPPGQQFMFGGVGMAAALGALEGATGRPVIWATAQYLSYARPPSIVDLDVRTPVDGKYTSQARVIAHVEDREILTVNAALGERPSEISHQWASPPEVPPPEDCPRSDRWRSDTDNLHNHVEVRIARGRHSASSDPDGPSVDGTMAMWLRPPEGHPVDAAMLAIMADHVPSGVGPALGLNAGGNSLDNTIRFLTIVPTDWVLCEVAIIGVARGIAHGSMRLFSQDGQLMATASQSMILRVREG
ncbi:acyl-CoA thioesterase [Caulobacter ginsengisoli]|uniref:Acyl-CoA thioesterase n=1 Tax=Caulobacter ginsengisoli TaxID=400775 RepID=A0ABU0IWM0_9CAUL|nr:acyl-CoA thioesterase domain-containing protein [Caulobacter ginsengisoli]MDQ0466385.1 acyl-CoA thioesterase [Caulobacter ginsengisoli]